MTIKDKLHTLLSSEIIPDLENAIDELFEAISDGSGDLKEQKQDLEELREMRTECFAILEELNRDELEDEEIEALYEELVGMKSEDNDED
ncbi:MAG: hypothetical protein PHE73_02675 [Sulfurovaceae bacterium]|nr:hypothetical protein [Sulfurovaceae bacterium]